MVSIVIPNFNGASYLKNCIDSILEQSYNDYEVIIIDNGSVDRSIDIINEYCSNYSHFELIENKTNLGFSKAVNQGIMIAKGNFIFLLNNDVELHKNCLKNLYETINQSKKYFSIQAKMIQFVNRSRIDDAGDEYNLLGWTLKTGEGKPVESYNKTKEIFSACAGAALYRKSTLYDIGLFDENFFAYMEDVDIGFRAKVNGYKNIFCHSAECYHIGSATTGSKHNEFKVKLAARNNIFVPYKNMPTIQLILNLPFLVLGFSIKLLYFLRKGFGLAYFEGVREGISKLSQIKKIKFTFKNTINYIEIQSKLILNLLYYLYDKVS